MSKSPRSPHAVRAPAADDRSADSVVAGEVKALMLAGDRDAARHRFGDLVAAQQRRAVRLAFHYLRDAHDADEAVRDAFGKWFSHNPAYRGGPSLGGWF